MTVTAADLDDEQHAQIERLAHRCRHTPTPCEVCTNLAVEAVTSLVESGWDAQIRRFNNRKVPR